MARSRKGFTLIELLIVVVIIGILAAIAIPKFADTKKKAIVTAAKSDLKNLVPRAEAYFSEKNTYDPTTAWAPNTGSTGVNIVATGNSTSWSAWANHDGSGVKCRIYAGTAPSGVGDASVNGEGVPFGDDCK